MTFSLVPAPWGSLSEASMRGAVYITFFLALVRLCGVIPAVLILYIVLVSDRIQLMWAARKLGRLLVTGIPKELETKLAQLGFSEPLSE